MATYRIGGNTCKLYITNKGWDSKAYKELLQLNSKKKKPQITQFKNGQMTWEDISPKKTYKRVTGVWKGYQHNKLSRKLKSKPQRNSLSYMSRWLLFKNPQKVTCIDKGVKKL